MFQLVGVRFRNYRCFEDTGWIPLSKFSVFIGKNDGGKSSALHAIKTLLAGQPFEDGDHRQLGIDPETAVIARANDLEVYVKASLDGEELVMRAHRVLGGSTALQIETDKVGEESLNQDLESLQLAHLKEICSSLSLATNGRQDRKDTFVTCLTEYKATLPVFRGWVPLPAAKRNQFPACLTYDETTSQDPEAAIRNFATGHYKTELLEGVKAGTQALRESIGAAINTKAEEIAAILQSQCDEVSSVEIPLAEDAFSELKIGRVRVRKKDGTEVDWTRIGRGKKREMSLAVFRWQNAILAQHLQEEGEAGKPVMVLFDEPDINLDYQSQCKVTESLELMSLSPRCQAIVATHSHNLINSVAIDCLTFFGHDVPEPTKRVWTYSADSDDVEFERVFIRSLGISNSSFFNERLFVCCSGETEIGVFPVLFPHVCQRSLAMSGALLINGFSDVGARDAAKILSKNNRRYVLLMDSDMKADKACGEAEIQHTHWLNPSYVRYLGQKEFEDLFDDETWLATLNELPQVEVEGNAPKVWDAQDLQVMRQSPKFSEALRSSAEMYSIEGRSKPRLGVRVARKAVALNRVPAELVQALQLIKDRLDE